MQHPRWRKLGGAAVPPNPPVAVTGDELVQHRLKQLEDWRVTSAATVRSTERDVDALKLESATVKALLVEHRTETREALEGLKSSLGRLHERMDEISTAEAREKGREEGRRLAVNRTVRLIGGTFSATVLFGGFVVALLELVLH
jgi:hypothetical protein